MNRSFDTQALDTLLADRPFAASDRMLVSHLREDWKEDNPWLQLAAALALLAVREGHTYLEISRPQISNSVVLPRPWPSLSQWIGWVENSPVVRHATDSCSKPLVLEAEGSLYLEKYYQFERRLADRLREKTSLQSGEPNASPSDRAVNSAFFIITGGPGTGKTTLALQYLNTLIANWNENRPPRFAAVAPTGKAAARLAESIATGVKRLDAPPERKQQLARIPCLTIHRLLGSLPHRTSFRRNASNPLDYDAIVIDEASMIDLPLMMRLFDAVPDSCRTLMLGDRDQLASVDVGSVLHDLLEAAESPGSPLCDKVERLTRTYRFREDSSIYQACQAARIGDENAFAETLNLKQSDFAYHPIHADAKRIPESALQQALRRHESLKTADTPETAVARLTESMILCPTRNGPFGTVAFNAAIERRIRAERGLKPDDAFSGLPIIILENDYELELYNGDLGTLWGNATDGIYAYFSGIGGTVRRFRVSELPRHDAAFALTIHKSQGSEFTETTTLFGPSDSQLLTRELLYTAFSRAREKLIVYGNVDTLLAAIRRKAQRATRLAKLLR